MTLMAWRLSKLYEDGKMSHAMASNVKVRHFALIQTCISAKAYNRRAPTDSSSERA